jgi:ribosomal protein L11 methylase PrmA
VAQRSLGKLLLTARRPHARDGRRRRAQALHAPDSPVVRLHRGYHVGEPGNQDRRVDGQETLSSRGERYPGFVRLVLTPDQRTHIRDVAGVDVTTLRYTPEHVAGVALLVEALEQGHLPAAGRTLVSFHLTASQAETLHDVIGGPDLASWVLDADHLGVLYEEVWTTVEPVTLGRRGCGVPEQSEVPRDSDLVVRLPVPADGTRPFGTGRHLATQLAAELLEDHIKAGADVLDVGTGSGILAVLAIRLGATCVRATDIDAASVDAAQRTAALNGVVDRMEVMLADGAGDGPPVDVVVANILAGVLLDLMPDLVASTKVGGTVITSGVVDARVADVIEAAETHGCLHLESRCRGGWTASAFRRT